MAVWQIHNRRIYQHSASDVRENEYLADMLGILVLQWQDLCLCPAEPFSPAQMQPVNTVRQAAGLGEGADSTLAVHQRKEVGVSHVC